MSDKKQLKKDIPPLRKIRLKLRAKLVLIFVSVMFIPVAILTVIAWNQIMSLGITLKGISVLDATTALNDSARESIERMSTDAAMDIANFLHQRDSDILLLAELTPSEDAYRIFSENRNSLLMTMGEWAISDDGMSWIQVNPYEYEGTLDVSSNRENNDQLFGSAFQYRPPEISGRYREVFPLYDEITFIDLEGQELFKFINPDTTKINYPMNHEKADITDRLNTYVRAEAYWEHIQNLKPGEIYVSHVIGAYVGTNYIGMYTPGVLKNNIPQNHPNYDVLLEIANLPEDEFLEVARKQAFAGRENPVGQRFEGIIRWITPVLDFEGELQGYVTMALNHDHIMEFVDIITPMAERYNVMPDAHEGNYAFIWDYMCRNIAHPRHHSIVGYNPLTGEPQVPWLEGTIMLERDYRSGGFVLDEYGHTIPIFSETGETQLARDTPFYQWFTAGGEQWLEANPSWDRLSASSDGTSWGAFFEANGGNREMLPQFGERQLRDENGNPAFDTDGSPILDYQSRSKTPARLLTQAGFVGLDGRFLNNAPQCTGWMDLTENGGSGSFYIYWSNIHKLTTAAAIPYHTGKYSPEVQGNRRGFAFVTIGSGLEDFTQPVVLMEERISNARLENSRDYTRSLILTSFAMFALILLVVVLVASSVTRNIKQLISGLSRFRSGERQYRIHSKASDEFRELADSFDEMADNLEDSVNSPLAITDMQLKVIYMNKQGLALINKELSEVVGVLYGEVSIYPADSQSDPIKALQESREAVVYHKKDSDRFYKAKASFTYDRSGNKSGYMVISNDVTEIELARQKAEQASIAKSNFLSNMSHEIRTPLNAIIGMTSIGSVSPEIEKKNYSLNKINDASRHLLGIINDILDVSKIEANKYILSRTAFSIDNVLQRVVNVINFRVEQKRQRLSVYVDPNIPDILIGDDQRLVQVITNLLSNSVKFTADEGCIHLEVMLEEESNDHCILLIMVSDTGIGMSREQQERLFTSFEQAEASTSRRFGGTGLGLVICKNIIEMMGGNIWVESELGDGAIVSFTVQLACQRSSRNESFAWGAEGGNLRLLIADDDMSARVFFEEMSIKLGIECDIASNGAQAVELVSKNNKYSVCIIALALSDISGIELAKKIYGIDKDSKIVLLMSESDWVTHREAATEAGVTKHLPKPLLTSSVVDCINELLYSIVSIDSVTSVVDADFTGFTIMLVEDVEINREIVMALLESTKIRVECVENGVQAVEAFTAAPKKYDLIFMDIQMPEMDGFTATRLIRESGVDNAGTVPIIAMTANAFKEDIEKCLESGMNGHLGKPLSFDMVIAVLEKYLHG